MSCSRDAGGPSRAELSPLPELDLTSVDAEAREPIEKARQRLEGLLDRGSAPAPELASAFGKLGNLYHAYRLHDAAAACYSNARRLAPEEGDWAYFAGLLQQTAGDLESAAQSFGRALDLQPSDPASRLRLAEVNLELGRAGEAAGLTDPLLGDDQHAAAAYLVLGRSAALRGDDDAAVEHLERVVQLVPEAADARYALAQAYRRLGKKERAGELLARGGSGAVTYPDPLAERLSDLATTASTFLKLGGAALLNGRPEEAVALYRKAVKAAPSDAEARRNLANALGQTGEHEKALAELEHARRFAPGDPQVHFDLGNTQLALGRARPAEEAFQRALELEPAFESAHFNLANLMLSQGRFQEARSHLRRVLEIDPTDLRARYLTAVSLAQAGQRPAAVQSLLELVAEAPDHVPSRKTLGNLLLKQGKLDAAHRHLNAILGLDAEPRDLAEAHVQLGSVAVRKGSTGAAEEHLRRAMEIDPGVKEAPFNLANLLSQTGRRQQAAELYRRVAEIDPGDQRARENEATLLILLGRFAEAKARMEEGLAALPQDPGLTHTLARLLAICPEAEVRDGARAVQLAQTAFSLRSSVDYAETVGMALAESGDFSGAVQWQLRLVEQARAQGQNAVARRLEAHLARYRRGEPVRMEAHE